jgi:hypothetical protein
MKLKNIRRVGRYINPETKTQVNIHKGDRNVGSLLFYYYRQKRVLVPESEFWGKWTKVPEGPSPRK